MGCPTLSAGEKKKEIVILVVMQLLEPQAKFELSTSSTD